MKQLLLLTGLMGLVLLLAGVANARPNYCGDGPVKVYIYEDAYCENVVPICKIQGNKNKGYNYICNADKECVTKEVQNWTDYPECDGKQIVSHGNTDMVITNGSNYLTFQGY